MRESDGHAGNEGGVWTEVSRRKHIPVITSYYITNIPVGTERSVIYEVFKEFGKIEDVYIPGRKDRRGSYFSFVKFKGVANAKELEQAMQHVRCGHCILNVNIAKYGKENPRRRKLINNSRMNKQPTQQSYPPPFIPKNVHATNRYTKTYVEVAGKPRNTTQSNIAASFTANLKSVPAMVGWNNSTLIGEVLNIDILTEITKLIEADGNIWFQWIRNEVSNESNNERIGWIKITGVPIYLRAEENYALIASNFGTILQVDGCNWGNMDLSYGTTCILTTEITRINETVTCNYKNESYKARIIEYDFNWHPFYHLSATPQYDNAPEMDDDYTENDSEPGSEDDDDSDGISDTQKNNLEGEELEEGEIVQIESNVNTDKNSPDNTMTISPAADVVPKIFGDRKIVSEAENVTSPRNSDNINDEAVPKNNLDEINSKKIVDELPTLVTKSFG
ncbi:unnamed protein product [Lactuca virosa]|uniref:RRM domain-containing protein n=1 Tax=Lactuca virosa TaxID=75947 RepID=A0AAU9PTK6_9ASTR|nr:unnamed protein product [Lactuca virosa]